VNRISIVKPDKARAVEDMVIRMARMGQLSGKLGEQQVIDLLEQVTIHR
jgi:programmed cell death protein 5